MGEKSTNKFIKILAIAVLLPLGVAIPLLGIQGNYDSSINAQAMDESMQQRYINYKKNLNRQIRSNEEDKIVQRCGVVKANLANISARTATVHEKRSAVYAAISKKLDTLYKRLEAQAFETTKIKSNLDILYSKIDSYNASAKSYQQALDDLAEINCAKKPINFIITLESARRYHGELITVVADIRSHVANTLKPSLIQAKEQIKDGQTVGGEQ